MIPLVSQGIPKKLNSGSILIAEICPLELEAQSRQLQKTPRESELVGEVVIVLCYLVLVAS